MVRVRAGDEGRPEVRAQQDHAPVGEEDEPLDVKVVVQVREDDGREVHAHYALGFWWMGYTYV